MLLQAIVIGRSLIDAFQTRTTQTVAAADAALRAHKNAVYSKQNRRRNKVPQFVTVYDDDLRVTRLGGFSSRRHLCTSANREQRQTHFDPKDFVDVTWTPIYRYQIIGPVQMLSRLKLYQTIFMCFLSPVSLAGYHYEYVQFDNVMGVNAGLFYFLSMCVSLVLLYAITFYLRRLIGQLSISEDNEWLQIAHLTFWGRRKDVICPVEDIVPLSDQKDISSGSIFTKLQRYSTNEWWYLPVQSYQSDKDRMRRLLGHSEMFERKAMPLVLPKEKID